ncbi:MAG: invasion associated locus B family protein [Alphaproteobacteria bacterium]|nr:invasion associated locus B family protein [Alphaproteobacteria bacterium]
MKKILILFVSCLCALKAFAASNADVEVLGVFDDWSAFLYKDEAGQVCYMATEPIKSQGKYNRRDDVFLIVAHRPTEQSFDVVSINAGYTYRKGSKPYLTIDNNKPITLAVFNDTAWAKDDATDAKLVANMKKGTRAVLKGTSARGTATTDTFSLKGFGKAYQAINKACGRE